VTQEVFEDREFPGSQFELSLMDRDVTACRVEVNVAEREGGRPPGDTAPSEGTQARLELGEGERLDQVVIGTDIEPADAVLYRVPRREHQHWCPALSGAELGAEAEPIAVGQRDIEHQNVVGRLRGEPASVLDRARSVHGVPIATQASRKQLAEASVVLQEQDLHV